MRLALLLATLAAFPASPPNDPLYDASPLPGAVNEQWDLSSDRGIAVDAAWPLSTGRGVVIADIDVGVQFDHPDLAGQWAPGGRDIYAADDDPSSPTSNAHGTNVAGVLAAKADNGLGIAGIAPDARILAIRTADNIIHQGSRLAQAIDYASARGARVASMSLGADSFGSQLRDAVDRAHRRGMVIAVASGNEFHFHHHQPQALPGALAVGGLNPDSANVSSKDSRLAMVATDFGIKAAYSDFGPHLDVVAPTHVPTTEFGGGFRMTWDGTSAATPHVAGVAALVFARGDAVRIKLSAAEVMQIIRMTADDQTRADQGFAPGWDLKSGWGRVNARAAVERVTAGKIPPQAEFVTPEMYAPVPGGGRAFTVRAIARGRSATRWRLEAGKGEQPASWTTVGTGTSRTPHARIKVGSGGWTLRLRVEDDRGNAGEDRIFVMAQDGEGLARGFPLRLGTSGEASPTLVNLDGRRGQEIVLPTADGLVRVYRGGVRGRGRMLPGWPRKMRRRDGMRPGFLASAAVGDIAGSRAKEVVAAGLDGRVYAWSARGRPVRGFPYTMALRRTAEKDQNEGAFYATPALADLNGDGKLDIVLGGADQRVHALDGRGLALPGWPVLARAGGNVAKILSSPAIGDLDGDKEPDIVEGSGEAYGSTPVTYGRVHAWDAHGKPKPGWPVAPPALAADSIPLAGEGVPMSPALGDVDGDGRDEVVATAFTGKPELWRGDGTRMTASDGDSYFAKSNPSILALGAQQILGRLVAGGPVASFGGVVDARLVEAQLLPASQVPFDHLMGGWNAQTGDWLPGWPTVNEGWQLPSAPAIADVDGDGANEVIAGSSGNVLHAWRADGTDAPGWPKHPNGWLLASPAVGDIDGDGLDEVVAVTRDGWLFAYDTKTRSGGRREWPSFRHDVRNTGRWVP